MSHGHDQLLVVVCKFYEMLAAGCIVIAVDRVPVDGCRTETEHCVYPC